ncbi:ImmA/IrrE family metallo-endopeptidase [Brevundimonas sp.]|uniref:ImmA/IrrE family metallo-endopeptidase n=1 Tax=Brevundimonas sp. TaxID=1871086 RepID=UPI002D586E82|nr:ImmA/IrrE family metallo-endopeptidase [Brevundimonas sp.]HYC99029.1 ImmA/IrrE family metallo-endopeptidase [Brevundimonas sp.]
MISPGAALDVTKRYWNKVPVDVFALAAELGLGPKFDLLPDEISGLIKRAHDDQWLIVINENHHRVRQRFTCAHEIGHFIFHRDLLADGVSDTLAYRADVAELPNPRIQRQQEWQANNFAANLLVPSAWLSAAQAAGWNDPKDLARHFDVSETVIRIKLGLPLPA